YVSNVLGTENPLPDMIALAAADVLVMLVDHDEFKAIPGDAVHQRYVVDTKGVWR
ncbi:hypothetical protein, partial [Salmonella enterica]|uniref:hypothetical protein n=1 Tax=Salmonella enterica TaxID=28901 RepID=UPI00159E53DB